ncbi:MAG: hypothetical protein R3B54_19125 [Bdellovibrionota bacterium]
MWRQAILYLFVASLAAAQTAPLHVHYPFLQGTRRYSVYIIKPVEWKDGLPDRAELYAPDLRYLLPSVQKEVFEKARGESKSLLEHAYHFALDQYTAAGFFNESTGPALLEDLKSILTGKNAVVLITEYNNPENIYQMVSVVQDGEGGVPLEHRLVGRGIERLDRGEVSANWVPDVRFLRVGKTRVRLAPEESIAWFHKSRMMRQWYFGGIVEIKTFIRSPESPDEFVPLIMQLMVAHELVRFSERRVPQEIIRELPPDYWIAHYQWSGRPLRVLGPDGHEWFHQSDMPWYLAPMTVPFLRNRWAVIEAPSAALKSLYIKRFLFEDPPLWSIEDPDVRGTRTHVLRIEVPRFEEVTWRALQRRPGATLLQSGELVRDYAYLDGRACVDFVAMETLESLRYVQALLPRQAELLDRARHEEIKAEMRQMGVTDYREYFSRYFERFE